MISMDDSVGNTTAGPALSAALIAGSTASAAAGTLSSTPLPQAANFGAAHSAPSAPSHPSAGLSAHTTMSSSSPLHRIAPSSIAIESGSLQVRSQSAAAEADSAKSPDGSPGDSNAHPTEPRAPQTAEINAKNLLSSPSLGLSASNTHHSLPYTQALHPSGTTTAENHESKMCDVGEKSSRPVGIGGSTVAGLSAVERARKELRERFSACAAPSAPAPEILCHCLTVDEDKLVIDSEDRKSLQTALTISSRDALLAHVLSWLKLNQADVSVVYVVQTRLHINFTAQQALASALSTIPFLARCGSLASGPWRGGLTVCGPKRHLLPEMLHLSCLCARVMQPDQLTPAIVAMLRQAKMEYTALWFPSSATAALQAPSPARGGRDQAPRISFYILPRHINSVREDIERLHRKFELWGGKVMVHAPNTPLLIRCRQCEQLGHIDSNCHQYGGVGFRLLFKKPVPFSVLASLLQRTGAKTGYLGSSLEDLTPSHKVTLLFDIKSDDESGIGWMLQRMQPIVEEYHALLHSAPDIVKPKDRKSECKDCGSVTREHECPFMVAQQPNTARRFQHTRGNNNSSSVAAASAGPTAGPRPRVAVEDKMCKAWRYSKSCHRLNRKEHCSFEHPAGHTVVVKECYSFTNTGHCNRGTVCGYEHSAQARSKKQSAPAPAAQAQPVALAQPVVASAPQPIASALALAQPASVAIAPAPLPVSQSSALPLVVSKKRRVVEVEKEGKEEEERKHVETGSAGASGPSKAKKSKVNAARVDHSTNSFAALAGDESGDDMDDTQEQHVSRRTPPPPPLRNSSLSALSSPNKPVALAASSSSRSSRGGAAAAASPLRATSAASRQ